VASGKPFVHAAKRHLIVHKLEFSSGKSGLNYFHRGGRGLPMNLAKGLCIFLNSTLADTYFRQFSGHTQVNALDLQSLRYPSEDQLRGLAARMSDITDDQEAVDAAVEEVLFGK
jgi:adenine-specific DNA-methyltransferase